MMPAAAPLVGAASASRSVRRSPIPDVIDVAYDRLVRALALRDEVRGGRMVAVRRVVGEVSPSGRLGMFAISPRRLVEIGWMLEAHSDRLATGRTGYRGIFVPPWTREAFLRNPDVQDQALAESLADYAEQIRSAKLHLPADLSFSGGLAVLHRAGTGGLAGRRFQETEALLGRTQGIF